MIPHCRGKEGGKEEGGIYVEAGTVRYVDVRGFLSGLSLTALTGNYK